MRKIFTFLLLCIYLTAASQLSDTIPNAINLQKGLVGQVTGLNVQTTSAASTDVSVKIRCGRTHLANEKPLLIVDGVVQDLSQLSSINPTIVDSVVVLKSAAATALLGPQGVYGALVITTKGNTERQFIIKDLLDNSVLPGATLSFISYDKRDTIMRMADDSGRVEFNRLKSDQQYELLVSAVGYQPVKLNVVNRYLKEQTILLVRYCKENEEVVLTAFGHTRRCRCYGCYCGRIISYTADEKQMETSSNQSVTVYPNPVRKGSFFTVAVKEVKEEKVLMKLVSLDGRMIWQQPAVPIKGTTRIQVQADSRWAAGIYFLQLSYANGKLFASEKIIIQ